MEDSDMEVPDAIESVQADASLCAEPKDRESLWFKMRNSRMLRLRSRVEVELPETEERRVGGSGGKGGASMSFSSPKIRIQDQIR